MELGRVKGQLLPQAVFLVGLILAAGAATANARDIQDRDDFSGVAPHHKKLFGFNPPGLSDSYYDLSCPLLTLTVYTTVYGLVAKDPTLPAAWLRLHFHDCFVHGCDASVMINGSDPNQELNAFANVNSIRGLDVLATVKAKVEQICPGVVSCADLLALAAREAVFILNGAYWDVPFGRRDGLVSNKTDANLNLPRPTSNYSTLVQDFANFGFTAKEMVTLSGAHTIGLVHCSFFQSRLYNFNGSANGVDPSLDPTYAQQLQQQCPNVPLPAIVTASGARVPLDPSGGGQRFDSQYFRNVLVNKGILTSDAALITDPNGVAAVQSDGGSDITFFNDFRQAMEKMGRLNVILYPQGQVRRVCSAFNS